MSYLHSLYCNTLQCGIYLDYLVLGGTLPNYQVGVVLKCLWVCQESVLWLKSALHLLGGDFSQQTMRDHEQRSEKLDDQSSKLLVR